MPREHMYAAVILGVLLVLGCNSGASPSADTQVAMTDNIAATSDFGDRLATAFGDPLPGLSAAETARFQAGQTEFVTEEDPVKDGLGPVFNDKACANCHEVPAPGGGSTRRETRFGRIVRTGSQLQTPSFVPLTNLGGTLQQVNGIGVFPDPNGGPDCNYVGELVPPQANVVSQRRTTPLFGLGLVDAIPEATFRQLVRAEANYFPDQVGRIGIVHDIKNNRDAVGRFGWKAQVPNLHQFAGDAYLNEMGITSPEFPDENCPQGDCGLLRCNPYPTLNDDGSGPAAFTDFMTLLAPPPRGSITRSTADGRKLFAVVGCNHCHTPTLTTGSSPVAALSWKQFHPYSDFLLHSMGTLADNIPLGGARGDEFRTAPLWGASQLTSFLHDGRAASVAEAVQAHDGQGRQARDKFNALSAQDRQALLDFVNSL